MRKIYVHLVFLLLLNISMFGQKVTLTPTLVNGVAYSSGSINLASFSTSTISLSVMVELLSNSGDNGTINLYYVKAAGSNVIIPTGGNGGNLLFNGGKIGSRGFVISLDSAQFNVTGGYIYAEYKTFTGVIYKSSNISVIKNNTTTPTTPTPDPSDGYSQYIPYGGIPFLPELYIDFNINNIISKVWVYENDIQYGSQGNYQIYKYTTLRVKTTFNDGSSPEYSREIRVSPTNFYGASTIVNNAIESNQYLTNDETPKTIIGNQATETHQIPGTGGRRNQSVTTNLTNYQWQSRIKFPLKWPNFGSYYFSQYGWTDIIGATEANYTPPKTIQAMEYRRLVLEQKSAPQTNYRNSAASNVINIIPLGSDSTKNNICCDQTVASDKLASPIIGDYQDMVQWQISNDGINWEDIFGANSKDYLPTQNLSNGRRDTSTQDQDKSQFYRRLFYDYNAQNKYFSSNVTRITFESQLSNDNQSIKIYPNPTTSILNIENTRTTVTISNITIIDQTGNTFIPNSYSIINSNLTQLDVSNLPSGIYFLNMIIKAEGATRGYSYETTFIKQ